PVPFGSVLKVGLLSQTIWLFVHLAPPWHAAQLSAKTSSPFAAEAVFAGAGWLSGRMVCTHSVIASSESLAPSVMPCWKSVAGGGVPAKPAPPCTPMALALKSVIEPMTAL